MKMKTLKKSWNFWESLRERVSSLQTSSSDALIAECKKNLAKATLAGTVTKIGSSNGMPVYIWNEAAGTHKYWEASSWEIAPGQQKVWNVWDENYHSLISDDGTIFRIARGIYFFDFCRGFIAQRFAITERAPAHLWQDPQKEGQYLCRPLSTAELDVASQYLVLTDKQRCQVMRKILSACVESVKRKDVELLCSPYCLKQYKVKKIALSDKTIYQPDDSGEVIVYQIVLTVWKIEYINSDGSTYFMPYFVSADIDSDGHIFKINNCTDEKACQLKTENETGCPGICKYGALLGNQTAKQCKFAKGGDCLCWFPLSEQEIEEALHIVCREIYDVPLSKRTQIVILYTGLFKLPDTQKTIELYFYK